MSASNQHFTGRDLLNLIDTLAPFRLAEDWDNVGLQIGDPALRVKKVAVTLELMPRLIEKITARDADAIIVHHPLIFKPLKALTPLSPVGRMALSLARNGMTLIAAHTNLDASPHGTNGALAEIFDIQNPHSLMDLEPSPAAYKLVVYTPEGHERAIIDAVDQGGGGIIGLYDHCSFRTRGVGTFRPLEGANPHIGKTGQYEEAEECRVESEIPAMALAEVIRRVIEAHPYEEVAYDVFPRIRPEANYSFGLRGELPEEITVADLARRADERLPGDEPIRVVGKQDRPVRRVAVFSGSGSMALGKVNPAEVDVLITGEIDHHQARDAELAGLAVIAAGHFATEQPIARHLAAKLSQQPLIKEKGVEVFPMEDINAPMKRIPENP